MRYFLCRLRTSIHTRHRYHTVQEFNKGVYDYIIASDESTGRGEQDSDDEREEKATEENEDDCTAFHRLVLSMS